MKRAEDQIQKAVVSHLRARGRPGLVFFHPPNGGVRSKAQGAIFKAMGVLAGVSDLILFYSGKFYVLELKAPKGRVSEAQKEFLKNAEAAGAVGGITTDLDDALELLEEWGLLR